jgi:orotate phosphoribosyltransferase
VTTDKQQLARQVRARAYLTGHFTLRSGATSAVYWDKYRFEAEPALYTGRPTLFVRKRAKPYGTANLAEVGFAPGPPTR